MRFRLLHSASHKLILIAIASTLMVACAGDRAVVSDQPVDPSFQERVTECSKIADRSERDRCLYPN